MTIDHIVEAGYVIIEPLHDPLEQPDLAAGRQQRPARLRHPDHRPHRTLIVHRFGCYFAAGDTWHHFDLDELAATFGVGRGQASTPPHPQPRPHRPLRVRPARPHRPKLRIRTAIPPLSRRLAERHPRLPRRHLPLHRPIAIERGRTRRDPAPARAPGPPSTAAPPRLVSAPSSTRRPQPVLAASHEPRVVVDEPARARSRAVPQAAARPSRVVEQSGLLAVAAALTARILRLVAPLRPLTAAHPLLGEGL